MVEWSLPTMVEIFCRVKDWHFGEATIIPWRSRDIAIPNILPQENRLPGKFISTFEPQLVKNRINRELRLGYIMRRSCVDLS
jgi:hypothetical protein